MKVLTIALTLLLLATGFTAGYFTGHYQGKDEVYSKMLEGYSGNVAKNAAPILPYGVK